MDDVLAEQVVGDPGIASAFERLQGTDDVPGDEDDLRRAAFDELPRRRPGELRSRVDEHGPVLGAALMLEPVAATDHIHLAVAVNVRLRQPFGRPDAGDRGRRPGVAPPRVPRESGQPKDPVTLDPEGQLIPAIAVEVAQDLVVVHAPPSSRSRAASTMPGIRSAARGSPTSRTSCRNNPRRG